MPSAKLLFLLPVPAPQLQILRSATTSTTATASTSAVAASLMPPSFYNGSSAAAGSRKAGHGGRQNRNRDRDGRTVAGQTSWMGRRDQCRPHAYSCSSWSPSCLFSSASHGPARSNAPAAAFSTATSSRQTSFPRHGTAVEPTKAVAGEKEKKPTEEGAAHEEATIKHVPETVAPEAETEAREEEEAVVAQVAEVAEEAEEEAQARTDSRQPDVIELGPPTTPAGPIATILGPASSSSSSSSSSRRLDEADTSSSPLSALTPASSPASDSSSPPPSLSRSTALLPHEQPLSQRQPPHMTPPPYVHHFDSYSLVRQLQDSGYTRDQAITAMKAVRSLLARNLAVAQSSLVSKSDVENEAYLFKAACAELGMEVRNNRRRADEQTRQQRSMLQHEVDIAAQSVNQELLTLNDVVRGLFNDRKMAVREEQKASESAIQTINYKITIMLNSEMRSEIEAVRWVLVRRSVLGIIFMAIVTLGSLRYASYRSHEKTKRAQKEAAEAAAAAAAAAAAEAQRAKAESTAEPPNASDLSAA